MGCKRVGHKRVGHKSVGHKRVGHKQGVNTKEPLGNLVTLHTYCPVPSTNALFSPAPSTPHPAGGWAGSLNLQESPLGHPPPTALP